MCVVKRCLIVGAVSVATLGKVSVALGHDMLSDGVFVTEKSVFGISNVADQRKDGPFAAREEQEDFDADAEDELDDFDDISPQAGESVRMEDAYSSDYDRDTMDALQDEKEKNKNVLGDKDSAKPGVKAPDQGDGNTEKGGNKRWQHRRDALSIEVGKHDSENTHIPDFGTLETQYNSAFMCVESNDVSGLSAVIAELVSIGGNEKVLLEELRTGEGDNLLIHAVKHDALDVVRYLLSKGSNPAVTNNLGETPLDIAVEKGSIDIVNAITEMRVGFDMYKDDGSEK